MKVSAICALAQGRVIGSFGQIPWHIPADLRNFKRVTMGKPVLMGRGTCLSLGRPLPGRENLVLSRDPKFRPVEGFRVLSSLEEVWAHCSMPDTELMVIGGGQLYRQVLPYLWRQYLTLVELRVSGDTFYPEFAQEEWRVVENSSHQRSKNTPAWSYFVLERL